MLAPENNPNLSLIVDPPGWLRMLISRRILGPSMDGAAFQAGSGVNEGSKSTLHICAAASMDGPRVQVTAEWVPLPRHRRGDADRISMAVEK